MRQCAARAIATGGCRASHALLTCNDRGDDSERLLRIADADRIETDLFRGIVVSARKNGIANEEHRFQGKSARVGELFEAITLVAIL